MNSLKVKANAKINIGLNVVGKRADGFHDLETIFYPVYSLYDIIEFRKSKSLSIECVPSLNIDTEENLIYKAVRLLEKHTGGRFNVDITLRKNIPPGGGMGGGSSDAAFTLAALNELFDLKITQNKLVNLSLILGSDVPFFLLNKPSLGYSRGEILKEINLPINGCKLIIVNPNIHISTKEVFANVIPIRPKIRLENIPIFEGNIFTLLKRYAKNDFEKYVFSKYPEIKTVKDNLYNAGALFASMSGTGSTVYGFFDKDFIPDELINNFPRNYFTTI